MAAGARCGRVDVCAMGRRGGHLHARETTKDGRVLQGASLRTRARPPLATDIWGYARTRRPPPPKSTDAASPEIEIEIEIESESTDAASPPAVMPRRVTLTTTRRTLTTAHTPLTTALRPLTTAPHRSRRRSVHSRWRPTAHDGASPAHAAAIPLMNSSNSREPSVTPRERRAKLAVSVSWCPCAS